MKCPIKTPVKVIETNGTIVDAEDVMVLKVLFRYPRNYRIQMQQLHYVAEVINSHEKLVETIDEIEAVSCGEKQIESDGVYDDSDGMSWIYKRIQALKEAEKE